MRRLFEGAEPGAEVGRLDVCDRTHDAQCGVFHQFLAHTAAPAGWICTCIATVLAFIQARLCSCALHCTALQRGGAARPRAWLRDALASNGSGREPCSAVLLPPCSRCSTRRSFCT